MVFGASGEQQLFGMFLMLDGQRFGALGIVGNERLEQLSMLRDEAALLLFRAEGIEPTIRAHQGGGDNTR